MIKKTIIFILLSLLSFSNFVYAESFTASRVKGILENQFSKALNKKVEIGEMSGNLYNQVNLKDVKVYESGITKEMFFYAENIEIKYSLKGIILNQNNFLDNISRLTIDKPWIKINRNKQGEFNILNINNEQQSGNESEGFSDKANIIIEINQGKGFYTDNRGWASGPIEKPFVRELNNLNGRAVLKSKRIVFQLTADLPVEQKYSKLELKGEKALTSSYFKMDLSVPDIDITEWANYTAPMPDIFVARDGKADLQILLDQKPKSENLNYKIILNLKNSILDIPIILKKRLYNISGYFAVSNDLLEFNKLKASINQTIPVTISGKLLNFSNPRVNLSINAGKLPANNLSNYISGVPDLPVSGMFAVNISLDGSASSPRVKGSFTSPTAKFLNLELNDTQGWLNFYKTDLFIDVRKSTLFDGSALISGNINISDSRNPVFDLKGQIEKANALKVFNFEPFKGYFSGNLTIQGTLDDLSLESQSYQTKIELFAQTISNFNATIIKKENDFIFQDCLINNNGLPATINGIIKDYNEFDFDVSGNRFVYNNYQLPDMPINLQGRITVNLNGDLKTINDLKSSGVMNINASTLLGETDVSGNINFSSQGNKFNVINSVLNKKDTRVITSGFFTGNSFNFDINKDSIADLSSLNIFKRLLPGIIINTNILFNGKIAKPEDKKLEVDLKFETIDQLIHNDIEIENARGTILLKDEDITFKDLRLKNNDEVYDLQISFPAKKKLSFQDNIFLDIKFRNAQIKNIYKLYSTISKTIRLSNISQESLKKLDYQISFADSNLLYLNNSTQGLLNKYQLYKTTIETIDLFNEALLPDGSINGDFFFNWTPEKIFINSNLQLNSFSYGSITAKNIQLDFETRDNTVTFQTKINDLSNQYNNFSKAEVSGKFSEGYLSFNSFNVLIAENNYRNIITGKFPLSGYWDSAASENIIDLTLNMPRDSISILSLLLGTKSITHRGSLSLKIDGSFKNPLISRGDFNIQDLNIGMPRINEILRVKTGRISVSKNLINVDKLNSLYLDPAKENSSIGLLASGKVILKDLSLDEIERNKLFLDIKAQNTQGNVNIQNLYSGKMNVSDVSIKGNYSVVSSDIKMSGNLLLEDGIVFLPDLDNEQNNSELLLDLNVNFGQNVAVRQGRNLIEGDLSKIIGEINIFIEPRNSSFSIKGPLKDLAFNGSINFDEGYIKFLNRDFYFINKEVQQPYLKNYPEKIRNNELVMDSNADNKFAFHLRSETVIFEETTATQSIGTTANLQIETEEKRFIFLVDGPLNNIGSFTFIRFKINNNSLTEVGEPYYLKDPESNELLDDNRFQELVYDLAPSFLKNPSQDTGRELARDIFYSEINQYFKSLIRPYEKIIARQTGLYDVRVKGDFAQETAKMLQLQEESDYQAYYNKLALELIYELYRERLFFTLDTNLDQLNSYKITWYILTKKYIDELSANFGSEYDYYRRDYTPMFSLEVNDAF